MSRPCLCLERIIAPRRERPLHLDLPPIRNAADAAAAMGIITSAVAEGRIAPGEAVEVGKLVEIFLRAIEATDFDRRLSLLEAGDPIDP